MAAIDNLTQAVTDLQTTATAVGAKIDALIAAGTPPNNDVEIQAAADAISAVSASLNAKII